jgi:hypothetical protein
MENSINNGAITYDLLKSRLGSDATESLLSFLNHATKIQPASDTGSGVTVLRDVDKEVLMGAIKKMQDSLMYSNNTMRTEMDATLKNNFQEMQKTVKEMNKGLTDMYEKLTNLETNFYHIEYDVQRLKKSPARLMLWVFFCALLTIAGTYAAIQFLKIKL